MTTGPVRFIWHDLMSTDVETAGRFYATLFGWSNEAMPVPGSDARMFRNGGEGFAGLIPWDPGIPVPSRWVGYALVESTDATAAKATAIGASIAHGPADIPGVGRFAVVIDPQGAEFCVIEPVGDDVNPPDVATDLPGRVAWNELATSDPAGAQAFYGDLFGWTTAPLEIPGVAYRAFMAGESQVGGVFQKPPEMPVSCWITYFSTFDIDATVATITALGGKIAARVSPVPGVGHVALAVDPAGAMFALRQDAGHSGRSH